MLSGKICGVEKLVIIRLENKIEQVDNITKTIVFVIKLSWLELVCFTSGTKVQINIKIGTSVTYFESNSYRCNAPVMAVFSARV